MGERQTCIQPADSDNRNPSAAVRCQAPALANMEAVAAAPLPAVLCDGPVQHMRTITNYVPWSQVGWAGQPAGSANPHTRSTLAELALSP